MNEPDPLSEPRESFARELECCGVSVEAEKSSSRSARFEYSLCMAARSNRRVYEHQLRLARSPAGNEEPRNLIR